MVRQIYFSAPNQVELREVPPPPPPAGDEVLLRPAFVGICGTDLYVLHGKYRIKPPLVIGHEMSGVVEAVGADVKHLSPADHVALNPVVPCGHCSACRRGRINVCAEATVMGFRLPGAAQTKLTVDQRQLHRLPSGVSLRQAALAEPLSVGIHAVSRAADLDNVLIIGGGAIGLSVLAAANAAGARRTTVVEPVASKRQLALHLGATTAVAPGDALPEQEFTSCFDIVVKQSTLDLAEASCMSGGTIIVVGTAFGRLEFNLPRLQRYELNVAGSSIFFDRDMEEALRLISSGAFDAEALITSGTTLDQAVQAYADAAKPDNVRTLIQMQDR